MDALILNNVTKKYDSFELKDISFTLPKGSIMGLIGENGAGKSTIINCILNLTERDQGEINVLGQTANHLNLKIREDIGVVFDVSDFYDSFNLLQVENILKEIYKQWDSKVFKKV